MEQGHNSKSLLSDLLNAKTRIAELETIQKDTEKKHKNEIKGMKNEVAQAKNYLRKMQKEVVKPMLNEVYVKDKLITRLTA